MSLLLLGGLHLCSFILVAFHLPRVHLMAPCRPHLKTPKIPDIGRALASLRETDPPVIPSV